MNGRDDQMPPWCDKCYGPVVPFTLLEWVWSWVCYRLVMWWPNSLFMTAPHRAILPWAGNIAYRCTCRRKP